MDKIFKYPAVQYIPLQMYNTKIGNNNFNFTNPRIEINDSHNKNTLYNMFFNYNLINIKEGFLQIKVFNGEVEFIKYRSYEVFLVGKPLPGKYQIFQITKEYFYKDKLIFSFYDKFTGEKLAYRRYKL